jgi:hypothetical protein
MCVLFSIIVRYLEIKKVAVLLHFIACSSVENDGDNAVRVRQVSDCKKMNVE